MRVLVTGAKGFLGKNLIAELKNKNITNIDEFNKDTDPALLDFYCSKADFVYHLAGANRPVMDIEFMECNANFTLTLLNTLKKHQNTCPVMYSSSTQASLDNSYGRSKRAGEEELINYSKETGAKVLIYRFPNVFGKWCRPNYNSAIATFCYNTANDLPIIVNRPEASLNLVYIDDLVLELIRALDGKENRNRDFCEVPVSHTITLGKIAELITSFKYTRESLSIPDMSDAFTKKLFSTYLSYLREDDLSYPLNMNIDQRGSFTEFMKHAAIGQVSVNISKPGIIKGNHWHNTKIEKFIVVSGNGMIRLRNIHSDVVITYRVSSEQLEVVDIPVGYTHHIENVGKTDMVTLIWANESFQPDKPDTYYLEV